MQTSPPLPVVVALTALLEGLFEAVAARFGIFPIRGPLVRFLWKRLLRIQLHFACLAARFAAGKDLSPRPPRPSGAQPSRGARDEPAFRLGQWVNPKFGWLCRIASGSIGASAFAWSLRHLLTTDPDMLALLAATPATARILRPLCWMLGVAVPQWPMALPAARPDPDAESVRADGSVGDSIIATIPAGNPATRGASKPPDPEENFPPAAVLRAA